MIYRDQIVAENTLAKISSAVSHSLAHLFTHSDEFSLDRFEAPTSEDVQALIGFVGGMYRCTGKNFAFLLFKALWITLIDQFDWSSETPFPEPNYG